MKYLPYVAAASVALAAAACGRTEQRTHTPTPSESPASSAQADRSDHAHAHAKGHDHEHGGHQHGPLGHRFEDAEKWVAVFDDPERDAWQKPDEVVRLMDLHPGHTVADVGAGTGYFLPHLSRAVGAGGNVIGIDIEPDMVRHMRERASREGLANVRARRAQPDNAGLPPASADRILIVNTWHHIPSRPSYARRLADALRNDGAVFVVDYTLESPHGPPKDHRLAPEQVVRELEQGGLRASLAQESLPRQYVVVGRK